MIHCIAIDDEPIALEIIKTFCDKVPYINLVQTFTQVSSAKRYLMNHPVDLLFLDIQMPDMNGIDFYKSVAPQQEKMVIFTTAHAQYALEGFNVNALDYLLKPFTLERFETACKKAYDYAQFRKDATGYQTDLYVRSEYTLVKIAFQDITYCESMDDYVKIHRKNGSTVITLMTLSHLLSKLPDATFARIHRSYLISLNHLSGIRGKKALLEATTLPIGNRYRDEFLKKYKG